MDHDRGTPPPSTGTGSPESTGGFQSSDPEQAFWQQFATARTPEEYCRGWLALQCRMISGVSDAVVVLGSGEKGAYVPAAFWPEGERNRKNLAEVAEKALSQRQGLVVRRDLPGPEEGTSEIRYHVAYPIQMNGRLHGVVALDLSSRSRSDLQSVLRQLQWGSAWIDVLLRQNGATPEVAASQRVTGVLDLTATLLRHERFQSSATAFATELATRLECDRVSIGLLHRRRAQLRAVSHSANFGKKTNLTRAIESAMDEALDQESVIVYPERPDAEFRITRAHEELSRQHGAGAICSVPLSINGEVAGALTLERPATRPFGGEEVEFCEAIGALAGPILELHRRDDRWLITKTGDTCWRHLKNLIGPRHAVFKLVVGGILALVLFFCFARADYRISANTILEGKIQRAAVAPFDGYIAEARVRAGDVVKKGDVLCVLDDRDLNLERLKWQSQKEQLAKQYNQALARRERAQMKITSAQIDQARAQLALIQDQLSRTRVVSQLDGVVVTGDLSQQIGAPTQRGEVLFEIAPLEDYRVILQVDEREIAEVTLGLNGHLLLSAFPSEPIPLKVKKVTPVSEAREGRNYFRVEAELEDAPPRLRPGMEGVGKITVDRRHLIWIWTHKAIDWLRLFFWSWTP